MAGEEASIVQKLWNYCDVLRDDGVSYGDYVEQLTYLLFLKMADEQTKPPYNKPSIIPKDYNWATLEKLEGQELEEHYRKTLVQLGIKKGMLGDIFRKSSSKIRDPAKLRRLITLINEETWYGLPIDVKGAIYEGLLQKNAEDIKSGAGQYFTPRPLIQAMVEVTNSQPGETICDPACGTGGFFIAAHRYLSQQNLDRDQKDTLKYDTFHGWEIVQDTARLCLMNLYLHGIEGREGSPITVDDSLAKHPGTYYDIVLTNPPFGRKSSITIYNENGIAKEKQDYERPDFWATTSNKQLNFLQHVKSLLKTTGRTAIVVPDNVLFEGGAGETVRRRLLHDTDCHTLLRLPTGVFYAQGVKANVLFFDNRPGSPDPQTRQLWIYDLRTNKHFTLKTNPLTYDDLKDFIKCYNPENRHERTETERFKPYTYEELTQRDKSNLDITWIKDASLEELENLPEPEVLAAEIIENLEDALEQFRAIQETLEEK
ncbi:SAM-dependent DNA methyltransferase [Candidatus Bathyarchaeota archaeon]|nr:SAM-dependent DNA methyltransferase [Candidatus Bathyarchaeota archaeon]